MKRPQLHVSASPHLHSGITVNCIMRDFILALLPAVFAGWFYFGWRALLVLIISIAAAMATELLWDKLVGRPVGLRNGSAIFTGLVLGLLLSNQVPWWIPVVGALVAIVAGKELFGGLGNHPFNSSLVGWAFLAISYKDILENYPTPEPKFLLEAGEFLVDPAIYALKDGGVDAIIDVPWKDFVLGNVPGEIGTICVIAILLGGAYLLYRRVLTWHIPISFIATVWVFGYVTSIVDPDTYASGTFHVLGGWTLFAAFFLAPEFGTAPVTFGGKIAYGIGCGLLTMIIRIWGTYNEGVPFAILLMNSVTPLLDKIRPRVVGRVKEIA
ncbi:MAG: RnfABCDGE type electron transport complex subunit D [Deltaproteobacteria bacterium]|nr:RnfABCDGE type electron transport complex subunit D [Deltaproteobacteria bacterium]MBW2081762.1 RnfABCDGE type electron transport complex subunit D [Deltaproteobacteria bacterium]HDM09319.1 RnfABCDGE type electron transport complex subunit D [Desulfobacteraceae bacterium]